ncbi:MAG: hypothetical protein KJO60_04100 [Desulfofustis sp.]|nr:hypothetical protein [Desulfofustis sp.]
MIDKHAMSNLKKMWTWLCCHPAHDREYYMKHVAKLERDWPKCCPLSDSYENQDCSGCCETLWESKQGTLCSDPRSPLVQWANTELEYPHDRSFYASKLAVLAMKHMRKNFSEAR